MKAAELVEAAGIADGKRIIADFAAVGFVKSYALSIETLDARGAGAIVLGPKIPKTLWKRIVQAGRGTDVWSTGTVHLAGSAIITGITFKPDSIDWLIAHHTGAPPSRRRPRKLAPLEVVADDRLSDVGESPSVVERGQRKSNLAAIPPGAKLATIAQAGLALGVSRGTINKLMNDGILVRKMLGKRAVRIETASIWAFAGTAL